MAKERRRISLIIPEQAGIFRMRCHECGCEFTMITNTIPAWRCPKCGNQLSSYWKCLVIYNVTGRVRKITWGRTAIEMETEI